MFEKPSPASLDRYLEPLKARLAAVREVSDPDSVHHLRVTCGRLRVWLELGNWSVLQDDLRWIRQQAARARDLDVQLEQSPPPDVESLRQAERERARRRLVEGLECDRVHATLEALGTLPPLSPQAALASLADLARTALDRGEKRRWKEGDFQQLHELRRAIRKVRYALEVFGEDASAMEALQSTIGAACDRFVALEALEGSDKDSAYAQRLSAEFDKQVQRTVASWEDVRHDLKELVDAAVRHSSR
jgi:CHAD domain-containing protein